MVVDLHKQVLAGQNPLHKDSKHRQGKALVFPCLSYCHRMAYRRCQYHHSAPMPANAFPRTGRAFYPEAPHCLGKPMGIGTLPWELHTLYKDPAQSPNLCPMEGDEMTVQQYYAAIGADYNEVIRRLGNEDRIRRFLLKFPADQSFSILCHSLAENQYEEAFRAAHSLKGISMNLGLTPLAESSSAVTEALRAGPPSEDIGPLFAQLEGDYNTILAAIQGLSQA